MLGVPQKPAFSSKLSVLSLGMGLTGLPYIIHAMMTGPLWMPLPATAATAWLKSWWIVLVATMCNYASVHNDSFSTCRETLNSWHRAKALRRAAWACMTSLAGPAGVAVGSCRELALLRPGWYAAALCKKAAMPAVLPVTSLQCQKVNACQPSAC